MRSTSRNLISVEPIRTTRPGLKLREASLKDYDQIASLETRHGLAAKSFEEWTHLHVNNPLLPGSPIGWVIEGEDKQIVGSVGNVPLLYELEGKRILAVTGRGLVTEPAFRSASLVLLDRLINQPGMDLFLTNAITPASAAAFSVLGCQRVPVGEWDQSAFWITGYLGFQKSLLVMKNLPAPLSYPLAVAASLRDRLTKTPLGENDVEVQSCLRFDVRFDELWEELRRRNPHLWIATVVDGVRLSGYAIFDRRDNAKFGLKRIRLVDYQSLDGTTALLGPMLSWALKKCRDEGIHMLEDVGRWLEKGELIDKAAPYRRNLSAWTYVYRASNPNLAENLRKRRVWSPSLFDATASL